MMKDHNESDESTESGPPPAKPNGTIDLPVVGDACSRMTEADYRAVEEELDAEILDKLIRPRE